MDKYSVKTDIDVTCMQVPSIEDKYLLPIDDVLHIGEKTDRSLLGGEDEKSWMPEVVRATEEERAEWSAEYRTLVEEADRIQKEMDAAHAVMMEAVRRLGEQAGQAWARYEPIQNLLSERVAEVAKLREEEAQRIEKRRQKSLDDALAAQDEKLGPRLFYITRPSDRGQNSPLMDTPTIHHVECPIAKRLTRLPARVRAGEAFAAVMAGGCKAVKRFYAYEVTDSGQQLNAVVCERCKAFDLMRAYDPETFMAWLERTESETIPSISTSTYARRERLFSRLGLPLPKSYSSSAPPQDRSGWTQVSDKSYRAANQMTEHEILIGWMEPRGEGTYVQSGQEERLKQLFSLLPGRGFAVRWIHEPPEYGGGVCTSAVAVRHLSKWEIRQMKNAA